MELLKAICAGWICYDWDIVQISDSFIARMEYIPWAP